MSQVARSRSSCRRCGTRSGDNFRRQPLKVTSGADNIIPFLLLGNDNKNNFPSSFIYLFTSTTPITEVLHGPEISVNNNDFISTVLYVPSSILIFDSVRYHNYKIRH